MVAVSRPQPYERIYTAEDLEQMAANGGRFELLKGELIEMAPAGFLHGVYTNRLAARVTTFIDENNLGEGCAAETGFKIEVDPDTVVAPDWAYISRNRIPAPMPKGFAPLVPDLVLETRSPSDTKNELKYKSIIWLQAGVKVVWAMDPMERTLTVYQAGSAIRVLGPEDTLAGGDLLPGFAYPLSQLFREPAPDTTE